MAVEERPVSDDRTNKGFVEHWQRVGPKLERIRWEELRKFRHEDNIELIDSLLQMGLDLGTERTTSGLVEMERLFMKAMGREK
jgi:hypothetical protein